MKKLMAPLAASVVLLTSGWLVGQLPTGRDPGALPHSPATTAVQPVKALQQPGKSAKENLNDIARQLPHVLPGTIQAVTAIFPFLGQGPSPILGGTVEHVGMTSAIEAKITLALDDRDRRGGHGIQKVPGDGPPPRRLALLTIYVRHFDGYWASVGYDCSWNKQGSPTNSVTLSDRVVTDGPSHQAKNMLALLVMLHIDKQPGSAGAEAKKGAAGGSAVGVEEKLPASVKLPAEAEKALKAALDKELGKWLAFEDVAYLPKERVLTFVSKAKKDLTAAALEVQELWDYGKALNELLGKDLAFLDKRGAPLNNVYLGGDGAKYRLTWTPNPIGLVKDTKTKGTVQLEKDIDWGNVAGIVIKFEIK